MLTSGCDNIFKRTNRIARCILHVHVCYTIWPSPWTLCQILLLHAKRTWPCSNTMATTLLLPPTLTFEVNRTTHICGIGTCSHVHSHTEYSTHTEPTSTGDVDARSAYHAFLCASFYAICAPSAHHRTKHERMYTAAHCIAEPTIHTYILVIRNQLDPCRLDLSSDAAHINELCLRI